MVQVPLMPDSVHPATFEDAAASLADAAQDGRRVRIVGGATKLGWGAAGEEPELEVHSGALDQTLEHNAGDLTAIFSAGVPLARAQVELAAEGQMLAIDPPIGAGESSRATIGGVFATGDCGPLRHRYGQPRDLILGVTVALSDGTVARAGGKVIKNVAGYDLAKLFTGSFGTLGMILSVSVRLHPLPVQTATALGAASDPDLLGAAAVRVAQEPFELEALDVAWRRGRGGLLAQVAGAESVRRAQRIAARMRELGLEAVDVTEEDGPLWARQRAGQRSADRALTRVAAKPSRLPEILRAADACGATLVGRGAFGTSFLELDPDQIGTLRVGLPSGTVAVVLDLPESVRGQIDPWDVPDDAAAGLMRRVKRRFDPAGVLNPGVFAGGI